MPPYSIERLASLGNNIGYLQTSISDIELAITDFKGIMPSIMTNITKSIRVSSTVAQPLNSLYTSLEGAVNSLSQASTSTKPRVAALLRSFLNEIKPSYDAMLSSQSALTDQLNAINQQLSAIQNMPPPKTKAEAGALNLKIDQALTAKDSYTRQLTACQNGLKVCQSTIQGILSQIQAIQPSYRLSGMDVSPAFESFTASITGLGNDTKAMSDGFSRYYAWIIGGSGVRIDKWTDTINDLSATLGQAGYSTIKGLMTPSITAITSFASRIISILSSMLGYMSNVKSIYEQSIKTSYSMLVQEKASLQNQINSKTQDIKKIQDARKLAIDPAQYQYLESKLQGLMNDNQALIKLYKACQADLDKCRANLTKLERDLNSLTQTRQVQAAASQLTPSPGLQQSPASSNRAQASAGDQGTLVNQPATSTASSSIRSSDNEASLTAIRPSGNSANVNLNQSSKQSESSTLVNQGQNSQQVSMPEAGSAVAPSVDKAVRCINNDVYKALLVSLSRVNSEISKLQAKILKGCISEAQHRQAIDMLAYLQDQKNILSDSLRSA